MHWTRETIYPFVRKLIARGKFTKVKKRTDSRKVVGTVTHFTARSNTWIPHVSLRVRIVPRKQVNDPYPQGVIWDEDLFFYFDLRSRVWEKNSFVPPKYFFCSLSPSHATLAPGLGLYLPSRYIRKGVLTRRIVASHLCTAVGFAKNRENFKEESCLTVIIRFFIVVCSLVVTSCSKIVLKVSRNGRTQTVVREATAPCPPVTTALLLLVYVILILVIFMTKQKPPRQIFEWILIYY